MNTILRRSGLALALGLLWLSPLRAEVVTDNAAKYAVDIPTPNKVVSNEVQTDVGKVKTTLLMHESGALACGVYFGEYPAGHVAKNGMATVYTNVINGVVGSVKGTIRSRTEIKLGDVTGWEIIVDTPKKDICPRERIYLVGDRLYQVMFLGPPGSESSPEALKFLDSFRLLR